MAHLFEFLFQMQVVSQERIKRVSTYALWGLAKVFRVLEETPRAWALPTDKLGRGQACQDSCVTLGMVNPSKTHNRD